MPLQLGSEPQPDFDQPIQLIKDCHRRIEYFFEILLKIADLHGQELDPEHANALEKALHYFKAATPRHTQDEEKSVFARLRQSSSPKAVEAAKLIDTLEQQHQQADVIHTQIDALGHLWLKDKTLSPQNASQFHQRITHLQFFYKQHIAIEENHVFPVAQALFTPEQLAQIGQEMKASRNLNPGRPESKCAQRRIKQANTDTQTV